jgi:hypothetical protein
MQSPNHFSNLGTHRGERERLLVNDSTREIQESPGIKGSNEVLRKSSTSNDKLMVYFA